MEKLSPNKCLKIMLGILLFLIIGIIVICLVCNNAVFIFRNSNELDTVFENINDNNQIRFMNFSPEKGKKYYICDIYGNTIDENEIDENLMEAIDILFKSKRITYIGWGIPISGNNWSCVCIGLRSKSDRSEYLINCKDENDLPDYSRNRSATCSWVIGDWYDIVFYGDDPTMGG